MLTLERLKHLLHYNLRDGLFVWKHNVGSQAKKNTIAGGINKLGYVTIGVDGKRHLAHRLAWFYVHGVWIPRIDHKDQIKHHNWIENLRQAEHCQNLWNSTNRKGRIYPKGVSRNGTKFCARISLNCGYKWLGNFNTIEEASGAYVRASRELHGDFSIYA